MSNVNTQPTQGPPTSFEVDPSLSPFQLTATEWLAQHNKHWDGIDTGILVFNAHGKILLLQRSPTDSMPNRWEIPGGGVDREDPTILHGAARELWEEAGLVARRFSHVVPGGENGESGQIHTNRTGVKMFCRFSFEAEVEAEECERVRISNEHQDFVWASEEEVKAERVGEKAIPITRPQMSKVIIEGFKMREKERGNMMN